MPEPARFAPAIPDPPLPGLPSLDARLPRPLAEALRRRGPAYRPRTRHLAPDGSPRFTNRLILESSPYLAQHAHNPVSWYAWGDEPSARARAEKKLVLLSVGYSSCHWCHVMERESFEDESVAAFLNRHFVAVKVDREERPDVDAVYMAAVQLTTGQGGWPMTVVLNAERQPIFGGTYLPARDGDRGAPMGFLTLLRRLVLLAESDAARLHATAAAVTADLVRLHAPAADRPSAVPGRRAVEIAVAGLGDAFDPTWGGFGGAPKFPRPAALALLARHHRRTHDPDCLLMLEQTLAQMAAGGIHDQLGGGFHRYATDREWLVPHFEKMLYDNAQLAVAYVEGFALTGRADFAAVARRTLDYLLRELAAPDGGFFAATDADSPGEGAADGHGGEGLFFTWTPPELAAVLGAERGAHFAAAYGVTAAGHLDGRSVLHLPAPLDATARRLGLDPAPFAADLEAARADFLAARRRRPPPLLDDKIVTAWNGLAISAFARAARALSEERFAEAAARAARFLLERVRLDGRLHRSFGGGEARHPAVLDDYAFTILGLLDLFEATRDGRWLAEARALQEVLDAEHAAPGGGYFFTSARAPALLFRHRPDYDGAEPSGNSVAVHNLLRLEALTGAAAYRRRAEAALAGLAPVLDERGESLPELLAALDLYWDGPPTSAKLS